MAGGAGRLQQRLPRREARAPAPRARGGGRRASSRRRPPSRSAGSPTWSRSPAATTWLASADRPIVASTPEKASSTGSPAATSAPNAISRMISVTGSDEYSARWKSLFSVSFSSWVALAKPNSATVKPSWRSWTRVDRVEDRLHLLVGLVLVALRSRTGRAPSGGRSRPGRAFPGASGERTCWTCGSAETVRSTSATAARNARIGERLRLRLDEHALARAVREAGVAQHLSPPSSSRRRRCRRPSASSCPRPSPARPRRRRRRASRRRRSSSGRRSSARRGRRC